MRYVLIFAALLTLGAGCGNKAGSTETSGLRQPAPAAAPQTAPEIPPEAKNVPRPY